MSHILKCHDIAKTDFIRAENCFLYDQHGRRYIDLESGIWCTAIGHSHPRISQVIAEQAPRLMHLGTRYPNAIVEETALAVLEISQIEEGKCIFLSSGSEAVEFGTQAIRKVTGRDLLLTFSNSYLAAYGSAGKKQEEEWFLFDWTTLSTKKDPLAKIPFKEIGGFVFEPGGSGSGFIQFPPQQIVYEIANAVKQAGGLVMVNEITTGMGRTGKWFGFQHYDIQPDIVALGKGLGNGYPVSAVALHREVAKKLEESGLRYAQSHQNDPLGCSVAKVVIAILQEEKLVERGEELGRYFLSGLQCLAEKFPIVKDARGRGMLLGLEFQPHESFSVEDLYRALLEQGFLVGYYPAGKVLRMDPALTIERESIDQFLNCLDSILNRPR
ncbi:MAG: aspartate aminotransferase family protein [Anaerolineaceae bacterium]|nr:aspartate aminotransferase family protein [Anaerolineaceae bacterium]